MAHTIQVCHLPRPSGRLRAAERPVRVGSGGQIYLAASPAGGEAPGIELANLCPDTIGQARDAAAAGPKRISASSRLCFAFLAHTGLSL